MSRCREAWGVAPRDGASSHLDATGIESPIEELLHDDNS